MRLNQTTRDPMDRRAALLARLVRRTARPGGAVRSAALRKVLDNNKAGLPGVTVPHQQGHRLTRVETTDADGSFHVASLPIGLYKVVPTRASPPQRRRRR